MIFANVLKNEGLEYTGNPGIEINGKIHYPDNGDMLVVKNKEEGTSALDKETEEGQC